MASSSFTPFCLCVVLYACPCFAHLNRESTMPTSARNLRGSDDCDAEEQDTARERSEVFKQLAGDCCYGDTVIPGNNDMVVVVASTPGSNPGYLADQPYEVHLSSDAISKDDHSKRYHGYEAGAYIHYILDHYDSLPPKMAFLHCHRKAWEMNDESKILSNIDKNAYEFMGLSNHWAVDLREPDIQDTRNFLMQTLPVGSPAIVNFPPNSGRFNFSFASGGAFLVSADRVRKQDKATWKRISEWLEKNPDKQSARSLEFTWHMLLGEDASMSPPDPAKLCPSNPAACSHTPYVDSSFPEWRLKWYSDHNPEAAKLSLAEIDSAVSFD